MKKSFGALVRQQRSSQGWSVQKFAQEVGVSTNFMSSMERGLRPPPGEQKIIRIAKLLGQDKDEMLAMAGKVASDVTEVIIQRPKQLTALIRRLSHAPGQRIDSYTANSLLTEGLEFYPLEKISLENHTAVIGESGSGKSLLTKYLIHSYFNTADVRVYDSDAAPDDWPGMDVVGRKGHYLAIAEGMTDDLTELKTRTGLHGDGHPFGGEIVRVIEEFPSTAAELSEDPIIQELSKDIGLYWLRRLLRRGRKYRMKVFAVAQEFEVNAWKIAGEGGLRRAFTVLYLGATAYRALTLIKNKADREKLQLHFDSVDHPCLVDVKGRFYPTHIPDLSDFINEAAKTPAIEPPPAAAPSPTPIELATTKLETPEKAAKPQLKKNPDNDGWQVLLNGQSIGTVYKHTKDGYPKPRNAWRAYRPASLLSTEHRTRQAAIDTLVRTAHSV